MTDPDRLGKVLPHLAYEVWMLRSLGDHLVREPDPDVTNPGHSIERNALIEAFILHARILHEFLFLRKKSGGRVIAAHYLDRSCPPFTSNLTLDNLRNRANEAAAHLTWNRIRISQYPWDFGAITKELNQAFEAFLGKMQEPYRTQLRELLTPLAAPEATRPPSPGGGILSKPPLDTGILRTDGPMFR